jgi:hypothetical protein
VYELFGALSYLVDPVHRAPAGKGGRQVEVWASCGDPDKAAHSPTEPPPFFISAAHAQIQKGFRKSYGGALDPTVAEVAELLGYLDEIRERLVDEPAPRLSIAGLIARLLAFEHFRDVGFSRELFREALFTQVLESHVGPTRLTSASLDRPLNPTRRAGKVHWPDEIWGFLNLFGQMLVDTPLDDPEVDAFAITQWPL